MDPSTATNFGLLAGVWTFNAAAQALSAAIDALLGGFLTWATMTVLSHVPQFLQASVLNGRNVRLVWQLVLLERRRIGFELAFQIGRVVYHDSPLKSGPPGMEAAQIMTASIAPISYVAASICFIFFQRIISVLFHASNWIIMALLLISVVARYTRSTGINMLRIFLATVSIMPAIGIGVYFLAKVLIWAMDAVKSIAWDLFGFITDKYHRFARDSGARWHHPPHRYQVLTEARQIRLLQISRKLPFDKPTCRFIHVSLDEAPQFDAISYTWGDPSYNHGMLVDSQWMAITKEANWIVEARCPRFGSRVIWLDSICINQDDISERSQQVTIMGELFQRASRVIVWLGHAEDAKDAYSFLAHFQTYLDTKKFNPHAMEEVSKDLTVDNRWPGLLRLLEHPFWSRTWIVQEIVNAQTVHILYAGAWMHWDNFISIVYAFNDFENSKFLCNMGLALMLRPLPFQSLGSISTLGRIRESVAGGERQSLLSLLDRCRNAKASDQRDKIYALQGVRHSEIQQPVSYQRPVEILYIETAALLLGQEDPTSVLHFSGIGYDRNHNLPSWVPDWSGEPHLSRHGYMQPYHSNRNQYYSAHGPYVKSDISLNNLYTARPLIGIRAIMIDKLVETTAMFPMPDNMRGVDNVHYAFEHIVPVLDWFRSGEALAKIHCSDPYLNTSQSLYEAYWRTLLINRTSKHPIEEFGEYYKCSLRFSEGWVRRAELCKVQNSPELINEPVDEEDKERVTGHGRFMDEMSVGGGPRRIAATASGHLAHVPPNTVKGDRVVVIEGAITPFLLRPVANSSRFQLVGECYVHGIMNGEAAESRPLQWIEIE